MATLAALGIVVLALIILVLRERGYTEAREHSGSYKQFSHLQLNRTIAIGTEVTTITQMRFRINY